MVTATTDSKQELKEAVLHQLRFKGKEHALTGSILANRLGERDTRQVRKCIVELIEEGHPIIGSPSGYFIAETAEECEQCLEQLSSYIKMFCHHYKYLKIASKSLLNPYQMGMKL